MNGRWFADNALSARSRYFYLWLHCWQAKHSKWYTLFRARMTISNAGMTLLHAAHNPVLPNNLWMKRNLNKICCIHFNKPQMMPHDHSFEYIQSHAPNRKSNYTRQSRTHAHTAHSNHSYGYARAIEFCGRRATVRSIICRHLCSLCRVRMSCECVIWISLWSVRIFRTIYMYRTPTRELPHRIRMRYITDSQSQIRWQHIAASLEKWLRFAAANTHSQTHLSQKLLCPYSSRLSPSAHNARSLTLDNLFCTALDSLSCTMWSRLHLIYNHSNRISGNPRARACPTPSADIDLGWICRIRHTADGYPTAIDLWRPTHLLSNQFWPNPLSFSANRNRVERKNRKIERLIESKS